MTTKSIIASERPTQRVVQGDARCLKGVKDSSVDLVVTSPPYFRKRDYGVKGQIGQESSPEAYIEAMMECFEEWHRVLRRTGSIFLNIGDSFHKRSLAGIPGRLETAANESGWHVRNRIIWTKQSGMPDPARNRLAGRHEYIIHFTRNHDYYYDLFGYSQVFGNGTNPGDVWNIPLERNMGSHLAPFPSEIVERAITLACPQWVCATCRIPRLRLVGRTFALDPNRPQARRAMEIASTAGLTERHMAAIRATGISDTGKALRVQSGTGRNSAAVRELAAEAKAVLGGYFREFTFAKRTTVGWSDCHHENYRRGTVLDPFMGIGTTLSVARSMGRDSIGVDLNVEWSDPLKIS